MSNTNSITAISTNRGIRAEYIDYVDFQDLIDGDIDEIHTIDAPDHIASGHTSDIPLVRGVEYSFTFRA